MLIQAVMWYFSMTQSEAQQYILNMEATGQTYSLNEILNAYKQQAKLAFYND